ncbi:MAG: sulfotransferase [Sulfitobacter sp.]
MTYQNDIQDANKYLQQGNYKRCLKAALSAAKKSPRSAIAVNFAGIAAGATGRPNDAIKYFQKALKLQPDFPDAEKNLAQTLILVGRADTALVVLNKMAKKTPQDWKIWFLTAQAELTLGLEKQALISTDKALAMQSTLATLHHLRSTINLSLGLIKDAIVDLQNALRLNPEDVTALTNLSLPLARQTRSQEALEVVEKAVALAPANLPARLRLATQYVEIGRPDDGIYHYRAVLDIQQDHPAALEQLSYLLSKEDVAALEPKIRAAMKKVAKNSADRACLMYALSAALVAQNEQAEADKMLGLANHEMAQLNPYHPDVDADVTDAILARFPAPFVPEAKAGPACRPVFVIGLPRSGTTLVEAMLGAHPQVVPLGERGTAGFLLRDIIEQDLPFTCKDAAALAEQDQGLLPELPEGTLAYVDKMPENYRLIGFLKTAYPDCRIINLRRDPRDIALSMWKSHFSGTVLSYTYNWGWMAAKFNLYAKSMAHWHRVLPRQVLDVAYEQLVADVEGTGRRMAVFCDLSWDSAMARPDLSTEQVLTLSATQLRRPVHTGSVGKWRGNTDLLTPFIDRLDRAYWGEYLDT